MAALKKTSKITVRRKRQITLAGVIMLAMLTAFAFSLSQWLGLSLILSQCLLFVLFTNFKQLRDRLPGFPAHNWWKKCLAYAGYIGLIGLILWSGSLTVSTTRQEGRHIGTETIRPESKKPISIPVAIEAGNKK